MCRALSWIVSCVLHIQVYCYRVHKRFDELQPRSSAGWLQLAALYAAISTLLPEPVSRQTGAQRAMELLRQSWVNQPLSKAELQQLRSVGMLGGHIAPGEFGTSHTSHTHRTPTCKGDYLGS